MRLHVGEPAVAGGLIEFKPRVAIQHAAQRSVARNAAEVRRTQMRAADFDRAVAAEVSGPAQLAMLAGDEVESEIALQAQNFFTGVSTEPEGLSERASSKVGPRLIRNCQVSQDHSAANRREQHTIPCQRSSLGKAATGPPLQHLHAAGGEKAA